MAGHPRAARPMTRACRLPVRAGGPAGTMGQEPPPLASPGTTHAVVPGLTPFAGHEAAPRHGPGGVRPSRRNSQAIASAS